MDSVLPSGESLATRWPSVYAEADANGSLLAACYRCGWQDFLVEEVLGWEPEGSGEHWLLWVRKQGLNTEFVAKCLARELRVSPRQVSWSGLKDRHAVTWQWIGVHLAGVPEPDWQALAERVNRSLAQSVQGPSASVQVDADEGEGEPLPEIEILKAVAHRKKLKTGSHQANRFTLVLREVAGERAEWERRLSGIAERGVPNYFGPQRFGRGGSNWDRLRQWLAGEWQPRRAQQGIYLSVIRSFVFNELLALRVSNGSWCEYVEGDVWALGDSRSLFTNLDPEQAQSIRERVAEQRVHPAGPLIGEVPVSQPQPQGEPGNWERELLSRYPELMEFAVSKRLKAERRALRLAVSELNWRWSRDDVLRVKFVLPKGGFATSLLNALGAIEERPTKV